MNTKDKVNRLHHEGMAVPEIAKKMKLLPDTVRGYIVEAWREDKEDERIKRAGRNR